MPRCRMPIPKKPEFPTDIIEDTNEAVAVGPIVHGPVIVLRITGTANIGHLAVPSEFSDLGFLFLPDDSIDRFLFTSKILWRFGKEVHLYAYREFITIRIAHLISFKTLLAGYRLFKKDTEQLENILKTAKTEDEFCILAGIS